MSGSSRDTDWYEIILAQPTRITLTLQTDFDGATLGFLEQAGGIYDHPSAELACSNITGALSPVASHSGQDCGDPITVTECFPAGRIFAFVAPTFEATAFECGNYTLQIDCPESPCSEACCLPTGCQEMTGPACDFTTDGLGQGQGSTCQTHCQPGCVNGATPVLCSEDPGTTVAIDNTNNDTTPFPPFSCRVGADHIGAEWFSFVAGADSVSIRTCNSTPGLDSAIALYEGDCDNGDLIEIACSEDNCGPVSDPWLSEICTGGLNIGETYYIQFSSWAPAARGLYSLNVTCPCPAFGSGACCIPGGVASQEPSCQDTATEAECLGLGGEFLGFGTACVQRVFQVIHTATQWAHGFFPVSACPGTGARLGGSCVAGPGAVDPWVTEGCGGTNNCEDFGHPDSCPIPADFFGPGSDPFTGQVCFQGEPLGVVTIPGFPALDYGEADTLVVRTVDPFDRCDLPSANTSTVDITVERLNLVSCAPMTVTFNGGQNPEQWDVRVEVTGSSGQPIGSTLTATKSNCNGGTFDSVLAVCPTFKFTKVSDPGTVLTLDYCSGCNASGIQMTTTGENWVHDVGENVGLISPVCSDFRPGLGVENPNTNCDCNTNGTNDLCESDIDSDGLIDACDNCPVNFNTGQQDADSDGFGNPCDCADLDPLVNPGATEICTNGLDDDCDGTVDCLTSCVATGARSCRDHGGTTCCLDMLGSSNVEPRLGGIQQLEIDLDNALGFGGGVTMSCINGGDQSGSVSGTLTAGNTVTVNFSPAVPDGDTCTVTLDCGASMCVRGVEGDIDRDGTTTTGDASIIKPHFNHAVCDGGGHGDDSDTRSDFNGDGIVTTSDFSQVKPAFNNTAPACP